MANPRLKDLRGASRRTFIKWATALGAAAAVERSRLLNFLLDEGGEALAEPASCATTNRSVHIIGGNGSLAWFQLLWPHIEVATQFQPKFAYHAPGQGNLYQPGGVDKPFYYGPEAPFMVNGVPTRPVTAFMAGANETHTQTPVTPAIVASNATMTATVAAIQRATPCLLPVIGVEPVNLGAAPGVPSISTVPNAAGMVELFNSAASQVTLAAQKDRDLYETYYKAILALREGASRPTWTRHIEITKTAANLLGNNLASQLAPQQADLDAYGITALQASQASAPAKDKLTNFGRAMITTAKAFKMGLTNCVILGLSPGATNETTFTDPHAVFNNMNALKAAVTALGKILDQFYKDLDAAPDPACSAKNLGQTVITTIHGDTPHTPLQADAWPDATPGNSNWMYVIGNGYLATGWFGGVRANGDVDGFDPTTGATVPKKKSAETATAAGAAVAYAVAKGDMARVKEFYTGPSIAALVKPPPA